jgi:hypothetical protein
MRRTGRPPTRSRRRPPAPRRQPPRRSRRPPPRPPHAAAHLVARDHCGRTLRGRVRRHGAPEQEQCPALQHGRRSGVDPLGEPTEPHRLGSVPGLEREATAPEQRGATDRVPAATPNGRVLLDLLEQLGIVQRAHQPPDDRRPRRPPRCVSTCQARCGRPASTSLTATARRTERAASGIASRWLATGVSWTATSRPRASSASGAPAVARSSTSTIERSSSRSACRTTAARNGRRTAGARQSGAGSAPSERDQHPAGRVTRRRAATCQASQMSAHAAFVLPAPLGSRFERARGNLRCRAARRARAHRSCQGPHHRRDSVRATGDDVAVEVIDGGAAAGPARPRRRAPHRRRPVHPDPVARRTARERPQRDRPPVGDARGGARAS